MATSTQLSDETKHVLTIVLTNLDVVIDQLQSTDSQELTSVIETLQAAKTALSNKATN